MTNILDTVEPDAWMDDNGEWSLDRIQDHDKPYYSRETVESLLEAHRKQVLLEAAAILDRKLVQPSGNIAYGILRRMAEGEKG